MCGDSVAVRVSSYVKTLIEYPAIVQPVESREIEERDRPFPVFAEGSGNAIEFK
jgi:hypothetical protein